MPTLKNKTILILSPQAWGTMFVSKHHYAVELAKRGNEVFFLNPPTQSVNNNNKSIVISASGIHPKLFLIDQNIYFPYRLKYHALPVFHWLMKFHIKKLIRTISRPVDIIWSFDLGYLYPLRFFGRQTYKIFHPVDEPLNQRAIDAAKGANVIISVTHEILSKYNSYPVPTHFINHGVTDNFLANGRHTTSKIGNSIRIGFSGNLLRNDIDRDVLVKIIKQNPGCQFECWGSYTLEQTNIGGAGDESTILFIETLKQQPNTILHGAVSSSDLAIEIQRMEAFLICYDVQKDQSKGTNYHKVMEYLSTGKVIISNNITTYSKQSELVQMVSERDSNGSLPVLFNTVINHLADHNADELQAKRINFARSNTYPKQIERIENLLT